MRVQALLRERHLAKVVTGLQPADAGDCTTNTTHAVADSSLRPQPKAADVHYDAGDPSLATTSARLASYSQTQAVAFHPDHIHPRFHGDDGSESEQHDDDPRDGDVPATSMWHHQAVASPQGLQHHDMDLLSPGSSAASLAARGYTAPIDVAARPPPASRLPMPALPEVRSEGSAAATDPRPPRAATASATAGATAGVSAGAAARAEDDHDSAAGPVDVSDLWARATDESSSEPEEDDGGVRPGADPFLDSYGRPYEESLEYDDDEAAAVGAVGAGERRGTERAGLGETQHPGDVSESSQHAQHDRSRLTQESLHLQQRTDSAQPSRLRPAPPPQQQQQPQLQQEQQQQQPVPWHSSRPLTPSESSHQHSTGTSVETSIADDPIRQRTRHQAATASESSYEELQPHRPPPRRHTRPTSSVAADVQRSPAPPAHRPSRRAVAGADEKLQPPGPPPRRHSREAVMQEQQQRERQQATFRPRINASSERMAAHQARGDRLSVLAKPKTELWRMCAQIKAAEEEAVISKATFTPRTGRGPEYQIREPAAERLYKEHQAKEKSRLEKQQAQQEQQLQECTFQPKVAGRGLADPEDYRPIHLRVGQLLRSKSEKLTQIRLDVERSQSDLTFAPALNRRSLALAEQQQQLSRTSISSDGSGLLRRCRSEAGMSDAGDAACTFAPSINPTSVRIIQTADVPQGFLERQRYFDRLAREKRQLLQLAVEDEQCNFAPGVSGNYVGALARYSQDDESGAERLERLAFRDRERAEASRQALAEHLYGQFTFQPEINPRSRRMGKATPVDELHANSKGAATRRALALAAEAQLSQECSFKPVMATTAAQRPRMAAADGGGGGVVPWARFSVSSQGGDEPLSARLERYQAEKARHIQEASSLAQYEAMRECTFAPDINKDGAPTHDQGPVLVPGLDRYMELQDMARKQKAQQEELEAKIFLKHPKSPRHLFTVPQPFKLRLGARDGGGGGGGAGDDGSRPKRQSDLRCTRAQEDALRRQTADCTFKPKLRVQNQRHLIKQILDMDLDC